jgi:hypothetical protein
LQWKTGTTDTLEALPIKDSILAITDEDYFDWPVLPEAPSSLSVALSASAPKLTWQVHGGNPASIIVERRIEDGSSARGAWERIAKLSSSATEYADSAAKKGQHLAYRVRAANADGESTYSNVERITVPAKP